MARRILVLEDDVEVARTLTRHLERAGCEVVVVTTCAGAEHLTSNFDVGVFDLELPDGNGADVAQRLVREQRVSKAVFFTGTTDQLDMTLAERLGPVVSKSLGAAELFAVIEAAVSRSRLKAAGAPDVSASEPPPSGVVVSRPSDDD